MPIRFAIKYHTNYGEDIRMRFLFSSDEDAALILSMTYNENDEWILEADPKDVADGSSVQYQYLLYKDDSLHGILPTIFNISLKQFKTDHLRVQDEWVESSDFDELLTTRPFVSLGADPGIKTKKHSAKTGTHSFHLHTAGMGQHLIPCITGSGKKLHDWDEAKAETFTKQNNEWILNINLSKEKFPLEYKVALFDEEKGKIIAYETGPNRILESAEKEEVILNNIIQYFPDYAWRGAGINVQLSSLKTNRSWGIGDFTDIFLLTDWAKKTGLKMIQLLPVNDTTSTHTCKDSYPYSAVSAFALHPVFLNVQKIATAISVKFPKQMLDEIKALNDAPALDYGNVIRIKEAAISLLYEKEKQFFKDDLDWFEFFDFHRSWLQPYAAFCYLRDKYETAEFEQWPEYSNCTESDIQEIVSKENKDYDKIAIHYFVQYHLHLQLKDATDYAHKHGVVLKADLPIGVGRHSVDTWTQRHLFHMDMQAGAPPDAFAVKGQNWSFPTYNWEAMAKDGYAWWRQRMEQLSNYFDAVRIDHVLGFFRIWSIPLYAVEGVLGRFYPAISLSGDDIRSRGIYFDEHRFCAPYITGEFLQQLFGDKHELVKQTFLDGLSLKPEFSTQRKVEKFIENNPDMHWAKQGLFDLLSNVIFLKDEESGGYHFRINIYETNSFKSLSPAERQILDQLYSWYFFTLQDELWKNEGTKKLEALRKSSNNMLLCGEDLGMVPAFVPEVLEKMRILCLQVERMSKKSSELFSAPATAPYGAVVTPSTHDMSTVRGWWEEDRELTQKFYNEALGHEGTAPFFCEDWIAKQIIAQHLYSPGMWAVFLMQDVLATNATIRRDDPSAERINIPADPQHVWNYRMHLTMEQLLEETDFNEEIKQLVKESGRG